MQPGWMYLNIPESAIMHGILCIVVYTFLCFDIWFVIVCVIMHIIKRLLCDMLLRSCLYILRLCICSVGRLVDASPGAAGRKIQGS